MEDFKLSYLPIKSDNIKVSVSKHGETEIVVTLTDYLRVIESRLKTLELVAKDE